MKRYFPCLLWIGLMLSAFCNGNNVIAKAIPLVYYEGSNMQGVIWEESFTLDKQYDINISILSDTIVSEGKASLIIYDESNSAVVSKEMEDGCFIDGDIDYRCRLDAGEYKISVIPDPDNETLSFFLEITAEEISPYENIQFTISKKSLKLYNGDAKQLSINTKPKNAKYPLKWKSSDTDIATVNSKGIVKAIDTGTATITATAGDVTLTCKVKVQPRKDSYNRMAKFLKSFASDKYTFRTIDVGNKCRLYATGVSSLDKSSLYSEGYAMMTRFQPYIELTKEDHTTKIKLVMSGQLYEWNIFDDVDLSAYQLHMSTANRVLDYAPVHSTDYSHYNYQKNYYVGKTIWTTALSSSPNPQRDKVNKLSTMLQQGSFRIRIECILDEYYSIRLTSACRTHWNRLIKIYKQALREY